MGKRIINVFKSRQLLDLVKELKATQGTRRHKHQGYRGQTARSIIRGMTHPYKQDDAFVSDTGASVRHSVVHGQTYRKYVCLYGINFAPKGSTFCTGMRHNRIEGDTKGIKLSMSMYIGSAAGFFFIKRRLMWQNYTFVIGPITSHFMKVLFGRTIGKVVYNDALDLTNALKHYFNVNVCDILDLSYVHMKQSKQLYVTTSMAMFDELKKSMAHNKAHNLPQVNVRYNKVQRWALYHLTLANLITQYLLRKQGLSKEAWKRRIAEMIDGFLKHKSKVFYVEREQSRLTPGTFTPVAFKSYLESSVKKLLCNDGMHIKAQKNETLWASVKSKSYTEKTALLIVNAFVISTMNRSIKPLYAMVEPEAFHQLADLDVGDCVEIVPLMNDRGEVGLKILYDRVCCKATRLHGDTLMYDLRSKRLVPNITRHH